MLRAAVSRILFRRSSRFASNATAAQTYPSTPILRPTLSEFYDRIEAIWVEPSGEEIKTNLRVGANLLEAAHENNIDLEGACECSLACSTCHVILEQDLYDRLPEPSDEENDMSRRDRPATSLIDEYNRLDMAYGLTETSRLGCQVRVTPDMNGIRIHLPSATRNFAVDGFVPKPH